MKNSFRLPNWQGLLVAGAFGLLVGCSSDKKSPQADYPAGESGTAEAIVGDSANLADPRPAPVGDTAENAKQADQFGETNVENVDSAARGLE